MKMNLQPYINYMLLIFLGASQGQVLVPVNKVTNAQKIRINELTCPLGQIEKSRENLIELKVKIMTSISAKQRSLGFECRSSELISTSYTNFFAETTVNYDKNPKEVSEVKCRSIIEDYKSQGYENAICYHPRPDWGYLRTKVSTRVCYTVHLSEWPYDFLKKGYPHGMFANSICKNPKGCMSRDSMALFVPESPMECPQLWGMSGLYDPKTGVFITSWGKKITILRTSCVKVCDMVGFASSEGHFIQIEGQSCNNPQEMSSVRELVEGYVREGEILGSEQISYHLICEVVHRFLESSGVLKPSDMRFFYPSTEGKHHLYRVFNGELQTGVFELKRLSLPQIRSQKCRIADWMVEDCISKTTWGGLTFDHDGYLRPGVYLTSESELYREIGQDEAGVVDKSPNPEKYSPVSSINNQVEDRVADTKRVIYVTLGGGLTGILIICGLIVLTWKLLRRRRKGLREEVDTMSPGVPLRPVNIGIFPPSRFDQVDLGQADSKALIPYNSQMVIQHQSRPFNF